MTFKVITWYWNYYKSFLLVQYYSSLILAKNVFFFGLSQARNLSLFDSIRPVSQPNSVNKMNTDMCLRDASFLRLASHIVFCADNHGAL